MTLCVLAVRRLADAQYYKSGRRQCVNCIAPPLLLAAGRKTAFDLNTFGTAPDTGAIAGESGKQRVLGNVSSPLHRAGPISLGRPDRGLASVAITHWLMRFVFHPYHKLRGNCENLIECQYSLRVNRTDDSMLALHYGLAALAAYELYRL